MQVIIIGGGKVGSYLARLLVKEGQQVRLIELRPERARRALEALPPDTVIVGDGTDPATLEGASIGSAQVVAAVTGADETNLVVTSLARFAFRVPRTIARVNDPHNAWMCTAAMGVDVALNQADLLAHLIAEEMSLGDMQTLLKLRRGQYALVEERVHPTAVAVGQPLGRLGLPPGCTVVAVLRAGQLLVPEATLALQPADEVLAVVHTEGRGALAALLDKRG